MKIPDSYISGIRISINTDYPGKVTQFIEFCGCNFRCDFCYTPGLKELKADSKVSVSDVIDEIRKNLSITDSAVICGGEPTLQKDTLFSILRFLKNNKINVTLKTNGTNPAILKKILDEKLASIVELMIFAPSGPGFSKITRSASFFTDADDITKSISSSIDLLDDNQDVFVIVKTRVTPGLLFRKQDLCRIAEIIPKRSKWVLEDFNPEKVSGNLREIKAPTTEFMQQTIADLRTRYPDLKIGGG